MKKLTNKKTCYLTAILGLVFVMSGCASNNCSPSPFGQFFQDQPIRSSIRSMFTRGDACNTCNPPVGQPAYGTNVAPLCDACGSSAGPVIGQPIYDNNIGSGVSLYSQPGQPILNGPQGFVGGELQPGPISEQVVEPGVLPPQF